MTVEDLRARLGKLPQDVEIVTSEGLIESVKAEIDSNGDICKVMLELKF